MLLLGDGAYRLGGRHVPFHYVGDLTSRSPRPDQSSSILVKRSDSERRSLARTSLFQRDRDTGMDKWRPAARVTHAGARRTRPSLRQRNSSAAINFAEAVLQSTTVQTARMDMAEKLIAGDFSVTTRAVFIHRNVLVLDA